MYFPKLFLILIAFCASQSLAKDIFNERVTIDMLEVTAGSIYGGTRLYIRGTGFNREGVEGVTSVIVGSDECPIIEYYSHDTQLVCIVPPSPGGQSMTVTVSVYVQTLEKVMQAECRANGGCRYQYRSDRTPYVQSTQYSAASFAPWFFRGRLRASDPEDFEVTFDHQFCTVEEDLNDNPMGSLWSDTTGRCLVPSMEAGYYNATIRASQEDYDRELGYSEFHDSSYHASFGNPDKFHVLIYPVIHDVSTHVLGQQGGFEVTISGQGFSMNESDNTVHLAGVPCDIISSSDHEIRCIARPSAQLWTFDEIQSYNESEVREVHQLHVGGRGLTSEAWYFDPPNVNNVVDEYVASLPLLARDVESNEVRGIFDTERNPVNRDRYCQRARGFLEPPVSANYSFYLKGDDVARLYISTNESADHIRLMASHDSYSPSYYDRDTQRSEMVWLEQGKRYFTEVRHCESYGGDWYTVGMRIHTEEGRNFAQATRNTLPERQMVSIESDIVREQQTLELRAVAGQFRLRVGGKLAPATLSHKPSTSEIRDSVRDVIDCRSISVSSGALPADDASPTAGTMYNITINCPRPSGATTWPLLQGLNLGLQGFNGSLPVLSFKRTRVPSEPVSGTFRLGFQGQWTSEMNYDWSWWQIRNALMEATDITTLDGTHSGDPSDGRRHTFDIISPRGNLPPFEVDASGLSGANVRITVTTIEEGSLDHFYDPIPADFFVTADPDPQVEVWTNNIKARCGTAYNGSFAGCSFSYRPEETPLLDSISETTVSPGSHLLLTGEHLAPAPWHSQIHGPRWTQVLFNDTVACNVTAVDEESIECEVGENLVGGDYIVSVRVPGRGLSVAAEPLIVHYASMVTEYYPSIGSLEGGTPLTLFGWGFDPQSVGKTDVVSVGMAGCQITEADFHKLVCLTPAWEDATEASSRMLSQGGRELSATQKNSTISLAGHGAIGVFGYEESVTPWVNSMSLGQASVGASHTVTFLGDFGEDPLGAAMEFADDLGLNGWTIDQIVTVSFDSWDKKCLVTSLNSTTLVCILVRGTALPASQMNEAAIPSIWIFPFGFSSFANDVDLQLDGFVTSIVGGNSFRGANLTITGSGFLPLPSEAITYEDLHESDNRKKYQSRAPYVEFIDSQTGEKVFCTVLSVSYTSIECDLAPVIGLQDQVPSSSQQLVANVTLNGIALTHACGNSNDESCTHLTTSAGTPRITAISTEDSEGTMVLLGTGLLSPSNNPELTRVLIGPHLCPIVQVTATEVRCTIPPEQYGTAVVAAYVGGRGRAASNITYTFPLEVYTIEGTTGSAAGGFEVVLTGRGFSPSWRENRVTVGSLSGHVIESTTTVLTFLAPSLSSKPSSSSTENIAIRVKPADFMDGGPGVPRRGGSSGPPDDDAHDITPDTPADPKVEPFQLQFVTSLTPALSSISPTSGSLGQTLTVVGSGFVDPERTNPPVYSNHTGIHVLVGGIECEVNVSLLTNSQIVCTLGETPAGNQPVEVFVRDFGRAWGSGSSSARSGVRFNSILEITNVELVDGNEEAVPSSGMGGAAAVHVQGFGFPPLNPPDDWWHRAYYSATKTGSIAEPLVHVDVCGQHCTVESSDYSIVKCSSPPLNTPALQREFNHVVPTVLDGWAFGSGGGDYDAAFDGSITSVYKSSWSSRSSCYVGLDLGAGARAGLTSIRLFAPFMNVAKVNGYTFEGSIDGESWHHIAVFGPRVQSDWNDITVPPAFHFSNESAPLFRYFRFSGTQDSYCETHEVQIIGYKFVAADAPQEGSVLIESNGDSIQHCNVTVGLYHALQDGGSRRLSDADGSETAPFSPFRSWPLEELPDDGSVPFGTHGINWLHASKKASLFSRHVGEGDVASAASAFSVASPYESLAIARHTTQRVHHQRRTLRPQLHSGGRMLLTDSGSTTPVDASSQARVQFALSQTPYVDNISPRNGSARGGDVITITGSGFSQTLEHNSVFLNGIPCETISVAGDSTELTCISGPRVSINPITTRVHVAGKGDAVVAPLAQFRYIDLWSDRRTWLNEEPPIDGDTVVVPPGQAVLLDINAPKLFVLLVQGEMIFDNKDLTLDASYIVVQGGLLQIGTEEEPFHHRATITVHGDRWKSIALPRMGAKNIVILDRYWSTGGDPLALGRLEIHGRPRQRTWTKVASSIAAGSTLVETAEDVDFEPGETIIVTAGGRIGGFSQTEERIVAARPGPRQIVLTEPLQFDHESEIFEFEGTEIDMRCEVGIISRNIVVQGDDNSPKQLFGVHTMTAVGGSYRVENAEVRNCGQSFNMGRYCTHFHIAGFQAHSYVKSNSIHHSFQRATTVHGTHHTLVKNNVAHYIRGHNYFVEDGIEMKNVIEANLGAHTLRCFSCLKSDTKPATFWMAGPNNIWRHNVAAGSINDGYWFEPPGHPHGPSFTTTVCPGHEHLEEFFNNTAHSNGVHGLRIYPHWTPLVDPCDDESGPFPVYLHNFTSFHNGQHGIFTKISGDIHHIDAKLVENGDDEVFWTKLENTVYKWDPHFKNLLAIASRAGQRDGKHGIFGPQNEYFYVDGATFVNYGNPGVLAACAKCASQTDMKQGGYTYRYQNLRFVNSPKKTHWTLPRKQIFWDVDGSLTGIANGTVLPFYEFNAWPECTHEGEEYDDGMICDSSVRVRRVVIDGVEPRELDFKNAIVTGRSNRHPSVDSAEWGLENSTKPDVIQFWPKEEYGWVVPLVTSHRYHFDFDSTIDFQKMRLKYGEYALIDEGWTPAASPADASRGTLDPAGEWVALAFNYTDRRWNFEVTYAEGKRPWLNTLEVPAPDDDLGTGSMINNTKEWHVMLNDKNITLDTPSKYQFNVFPLQCPPDGCYVPPPPDWRTPVYWSSPSTWPNGFLPQAGENVVINSTTYVIMDINPPPLGKVEVQGRLDFGENGDRTLEADSLVVYGHLQIGESQRRPYPRQAKILLKGSRNSEAVIVDNTLFLGNKVMVVVGTALLYGKPVTDTWVRLRSTASAGSSTIELHSDPGWAVGSEIVLTTTEYGLEQTETRTITSKSGRQLTLNAPLTYSHYAGVVSVTDPDNHAVTKDIALRGAVGLLSRNIKIEGKVASDTDGYGAHVVVAEIPPTSHGSQSGQERARIGKLEAYYVGFEKTGKQSSEHPSVLFKYQFNGESPAPQNEPDTIPSNVLEGCAFAHTLNYAVVAQMARNVRLIGNVFHRTFRSAVDFDARSTNATIDGNLVAGSHRSPDEVDTWVSPIAAFYIGVPVRSMSNNLAAGSDDAGFVFRPDLCSETEVQLGTGAGASRAGGAGAGTSGGSAATHAVHHNEAVGCVIGGWILPRTRTCVSVTDFTAWKNSHIGLFTIDQTANLVVQRAVVADNHIGMSFNFFRAAAYNQVDIRSSVVIGSSSASTCDDSTQCRAVAQNDVKGQGCNSVFGGAFRRVGVILPQYLNRAKTCEIDQGLEVCRPPTRPERLCGLPWEKRYGLPSASNAYMNVSSVTFAQFARDDCDQRSVAFAWNPTQQDWSPSTGFSNIAWSNTPSDARFLLDKVGGTTPGSCTTGCDGKNFITLQDLDGTLLAQQTATPGVRLASGGGTILGHNGLLAQPSPHCTEDTAWGAYVCTEMAYRGVVVESRDRDRGGRRLGPFRPTPILPAGSSTMDNRTYGSVGPFDDACAKRFHFGQFPFSVIPGLRYDLKAAATLPERLRFHFLSDDPDEAVVIELFFIEPLARELFVNGQKIPANNGTVPTLADPRGANVFNPQARRFYFVMRGGDPFATYDIVMKPTVQLTMHMEISFAEFVSDRFKDNLAVLLGIDEKLIKIVDLRPGSVIADVEIVDEEDTQVNDETATAQFDRLASVANNVVKLANQGQLNVGYPLIDLSMKVPKPPAVSVVVGGDRDPNDPAVQAEQAGSNYGTGTATDLGAGERQSIRIGPEPEEGLSTAALAGIIGGCAAALIIGLVTGLLIARSRKHKRSKRVSQSNEPPPGMAPPGMSLGNEAEGSGVVASGPRPARVQSWRLSKPPHETAGAASPEEKPFAYENPTFHRG